MNTTHVLRPETVVEELVAALTAPCSLSQRLAPRVYQR